MNISELNLSVRSYNLLHRKGIIEAETLLSMTDDDIIGLYNGRAAIAEILEMVKLLREVGAERLNEYLGSQRRKGSIL